MPGWEPPITPEWVRARIERLRQTNSTQFKHRIGIWGATPPRATQADPRVNMSLIWDPSDAKKLFVDGIGPGLGLTENAIGAGPGLTEDYPFKPALQTSPSNLPFKPSLPTFHSNLPFTPTPQTVPPDLLLKPCLQTLHSNLPFKPALQIFLSNLPFEPAPSHPNLHSNLPFKPTRQTFSSNLPTRPSHQTLL